MSSSDFKPNAKLDSTFAAYTRGGRLPHAILIEGAEPRLDFAKRIAYSVLCESGVDKPCGVCRHCVKAGKDVHPDLLVYSGGERVKSFHVDTVRQLKREAFVKPNEAAAKVLILENVHNMTVQAQNALLKIIEEPPPNIVFILTCENKASLLETVLSRVSVFSLEGSAATRDSQDTELTQKAETILNQLLSGSELEVLVALAPYERDRAGLAALLSELRAVVAQSALVAARAGKSGEALKLKDIAGIIDEIEAGLNQNVGGLLMTAMLPVTLKSR